MTRALHPVLDRLLKRVGTSRDRVPSPEAWQELIDLVDRTYRDADQDRYTIERAMDISSEEMQELYRALEDRAEREIAVIRQSDERHRLLFESNPLPMWILDAETLMFVDVNTAMITAYGYSRDELLSMRIMDIKLPEEIDEMIRGVRGAPIDAVHHVGMRKHRRKDGGVLEMDITVHSLLIDGRRGILGVALDMTQARRVEEELRQAQKMEAVGRLAGGIAHDFNNILAVILANAEYVLQDLGDGSEAAKGIAEIRSAATRAASLTRQLLTFSRKQKRQPKAIALNAVVTGLERMLTRIVGEDIAMSALIAPDLGTIEADPGEVEQVLMNLVVNARDAMPAGGKVLLETANTIVDDAQGRRIGLPAGAYVTLSVTDTGCGMTEAVRVRIFEPFFTTKDVDKGTGLGLATVFGIVKESGGAICVYSEPDRGTTFRIYWPRIDGVPAHQAVSHSAPVHGSGVILVVEDDAQLRHIIRRYLASWGYTPLEAPSGAHALDVVRGHAGPIDVLLTDLVMPGIDGRALSQRVLTEKPGIKVVFMSGYTEHAALQTAALGPEDLFVQKPFTARVLSETLHRALSTTRSDGDNPRVTNAPLQPGR